MRTHAVKVDATPGRDGVEVDGRPLGGVRRVEIDYAVGNLCEVTLHLDLIEGALVTSKNAVVIVPDATRDSLVSLGWTPPRARPLICNNADQHIPGCDCGHRRSAS